MRNKRKIKQERKQKFFNKIVTKRDFIEYIHYLDGIGYFDSAKSISKREVYKFMLYEANVYFDNQKDRIELYGHSFTRKLARKNIDLIVNINNCIFLEKSNI